MTTKQAIDDIVSFHTLPPQIDYARPYSHKANQAEDFLNTLPEPDRTNAFEEANRRVTEYHDSPAAELDSKF